MQHPLAIIKMNSVQAGGMIPLHLLCDRDALLGTPMWVVESPLNIMKRIRGGHGPVPIISFCTSPFFGESLSAMLALSRPL